MCAKQRWAHKPAEKLKSAGPYYSGRRSAHQNHERREVRGDRPPTAFAQHVLQPVKKRLWFHEKSWQSLPEELSHSAILTQCLRNYPVKKALKNSHSVSQKSSSKQSRRSAVVVYVQMKNGETRRELINNVAIIRLSKVLPIRGTGFRYGTRSIAW